MNAEEMSMGFSVLCAIRSGSTPFNYWREVRFK